MLLSLAHTREELAAAIAANEPNRAVVMTMGALHEGHLDLLRRAGALVGAGGTVVVTIFVNPLQFAPGEDLDAYPRDLEGDVEKLRTVAENELQLSQLVVFAPTPEVVYPSGTPQVTINPGPIATVLEGATRPTHFGGVCQVVLNLMHLTRPTWALFGRKDAQQLAIVRAMVRDLSVPLISIEPVDIRRESDGLAMSSRNAYLTPTQRQQALALSQALKAGIAAAENGGDGAAVRQAALAYLANADGVEVDYVAVVGADSFVDLAGAGLGLDPQKYQPVAGEQALLALAAKVGSTRLIDNTLITLR